MKVMFSDKASTTGYDQYLDGRLKPLLILQRVTEAIFNSHWPETREMVHMLETCLTVNFNVQCIRSHRVRILFVLCWFHSKTLTITKSSLTPRV